jgi:pyruvate dehydrogenase E1 component
MDMSPTSDTDPQETQEWLDALDSVLEYEGTQRAHYLLEKLMTSHGAPAPICLTAPIPLTSTPFRPGRRSALPAIMSSSTASARTCGGMRWRWWSEPTRSLRSWAGTSPASLPLPPCTTSVSITSGARRAKRTAPVYAQGHSAPGIYPAPSSRAVTVEQLDNFRQEVDGKVCPPTPPPGADFSNSTVSMGQGTSRRSEHFEVLARPRHPQHRRPQGVGFLGDGEMDEPESLDTICAATLDN